MKTISIKEFKELINRDDWHRKQNYRITLCSPRYSSYQEKDLMYTQGWGIKRSILEGIEIIFMQPIGYFNHSPQDIYVRDGEEWAIWLINGIKVIDDNGRPLDGWDISTFLPKDFSKINYPIL